MKPARLLLIALLLQASGVLGDDRLTVIPARPVAGEPFVLVLDGETTEIQPFYRKFTTLTISGSELTLGVDIANRGIGPGVQGNPFIFSQAFLGRQATTLPAAGTYPVYVTTGGPRKLMTTITVDPPRAAAMPASTALSGNYFAADENGAGINVIQGASGQIFAAWFTYNAVEAVFYYNPVGPGPSWYVISGGKWITPTEFQGVMYETYAPPIGSPYDATRFTAVPAGLMTMRFPDRNTLEMDAQFDIGFRKQKTLQRQQF